MKSIHEFIVWLGTQGDARSIYLSPEDFTHLRNIVSRDCLVQGRVWISRRCIEMRPPVGDTLDVSDRRLFADD